MLQKKFFNSLRGIGADLAWCHWNRLGVSGYGKANRCSTDPEALIVLTSIVGRHDLRLVEIMNEWLRNYESLISVERLKRCIGEMRECEDHAEGTFDVLRVSVAMLNSKRWRSVFELLGLAQTQAKKKKDQKISRKKLEEHNKIIKNNRQLFLRLLFGVGSRADIIYFAGVVPNQKKNPFDLRISAPHLTHMLHYNNSSIFRTLCDLEQAGVFVVDPRTISGKNRIYLPNMQFSGAKDIFGVGKEREKAFVDWLAIAKICRLIESLESYLEGIDDLSIIKSRINAFILSCFSLAADACIEIGGPLRSISSHTALADVALDELQSRAVSLMNGVYGFLV